MAAGAVVLLGYLAVTGRLGDLAHFDGQQWVWLSVTAVLLAAYVSTWYAALKHAPAAAVTCVLTAISIGLLSSLLPAWNASRTSIIEALRSTD